MGYQRTTVGALDQWADEVGDETWAYDNVGPYYEKSLNFTPPDMSKRIANATPNYDPSTLGTGGPLALTYPNYAQPFSTWVARAMEYMGIPHVNGFTSGYLNGSSWLVNTINHATGFRESSETAFLRPFLDRPNLLVYRRTLAEKVLFDGDVATGVQVDLGSGLQSLTLAARKEVVLSAGVFQSPQLLLVSGVGPSELLQEHGIKVVADRKGVGQGMNDHVFFGIAYQVNVQTQTVLSDPEFYQHAVHLLKAKQTGPLSSPGGDYAAYENFPAEYRANMSRSTLQGTRTRPT
jgi:choline dehydrogenase